MKVKMKVKKWSSEKLKMGKKHFFLNCLGTFGVSFALRKQVFIRDEKWSLNWCRITSWVFSMHRFGLNPYLELIYQLFKKSLYFLAFFWRFLGPLGPPPKRLPLAEALWQKTHRRRRKRKCLGALRVIPSGNQVDGLPPASSYQFGDKQF